MAKKNTIITGKEIICKKMAMRLPATIALIFISIFVLLVIALHFLRPDLDALSTPTSAYAVGQYGFLMTGAFLCMSIASWSLLIALLKGIARPAQSRVGLLFLGMWAAAVIVAMIFPIDVAGAPVTVSGRIHRTNGPIAFTSLTLATFLITLKLRYEHRQPSFYSEGRILSWLIVAMFVISIINIRLQTGFEGLCQRVFLALIATWFIVIATQLRKLNSFINA
jgi:uncharacterized protein DUF998